MIFLIFCLFAKKPIIGGIYAHVERVGVSRVGDLVKTDFSYWLERYGNFAE